jgi:hypothetical protein
MHTLEQLLSWTAIVAGLASAWLWYRASAVVVLKGDPRSKGGFLLGNKDGTQVDVYSTMFEASKINKHAAIATALAVLFGALASVVNNLG